MALTQLGLAAGGTASEAREAIESGGSTGPDVTEIAHNLQRRRLERAYMLRPVAAALIAELAFGAAT